MTREIRPLAVVAALAALAFISLYFAPIPHVAAVTPVAVTARASAAAVPSPAAPFQSPPALVTEDQLVSGPDGTQTLAHLVHKSESVSSLVRAYWPQSVYMRRAELEAAMRAANGNLKGEFLKPGAIVSVPGLERQPLVENAVPRPRDFEVRAIYLTGIMAGSENGMRLVEHWREAGGNAVVFDVKDSDGSINIPFTHPLAGRARPAIPNLPKYVRWLHRQGLHVIARIAIFRDELLVARHPELAVQSRRSGQPWRENGKLVWTDPSHRAVQDYNIALAKAAMAGGVDEVQFDYVRFPAEGDQKDAYFQFERETPARTRADVMDGFLARAYTEIRAQHALFSLDVFGVMAWQRPVDLAHTGQDIVRMARHCDVLSPMIYPSHFFGMDGYANPGDAPGHFIGESMDRFAKITAGSGVVLRPWLQAFGWRTRTYSADYILAQVSTSKARGGMGFLFWNARNDYSKPLAAMPLMAKAPDKYFGPPRRPAKPAETAITHAELPPVTAAGFR